MKEGFDPLGTAKMTYFVYLIVSNPKNNKKFSYVGYTNDLKKRINAHNEGKGAKFTRGKKVEVSLL